MAISSQERRRHCSPKPENIPRVIFEKVELTLYLPTVGMVVKLSDTALRKKRQVVLNEFKARLVYVVGSRPAYVRLCLRPPSPNKMHKQRDTGLMNLPLVESSILRQCTKMLTVFTAMKKNNEKFSMCRLGWYETLNIDGLTQKILLPLSLKG